LAEVVLITKMNTVIGKYIKGLNIFLLILHEMFWTLYDCLWSMNFCPCIFKKILQNLPIFDELMIFVSWKNSENAISDHLETADFRNFLKCSAFISAKLPFTTKSSPRKNNTLQSGRLEPRKIYRGSRGSLRGKETRGEKEEPLVTSVANPTSTLD
jgi:hypothetical protein